MFPFMTDLWIYGAVAAAAYLIGSLNGSLMASRWLMRDDIRNHGSGNAGATNVLRTYGIKWTVAVALWDIGKGVLAVHLASLFALCRFPSGELLEDNPYAGYVMLAAGFFVIVGHVFPVFFKFKGGKGIFTACGVIFTLSWEVAAIALTLFLLVVLLTRYVSLGSIFGMVSLPVSAFFLYDWVHVAAYAALTVLIVFLHRGNIKRLVTGTENKIGRKKP
jgi:glycerol-3-phosphate acyltransferase PlsY